MHMRDRRRAACRSGATGQVANSTDTSLETAWTGRVSVPPSSVLRLHIRSRLLSGLSACSAVAMESRQVDRLVRISNGRCSHPLYAVWAYCGPYLDLTIRTLVRWIVGPAMRCTRLQQAPLRVAARVIECDVE